MRDTIEQELYERNNKRNIDEVSLNFSSSSNIQLGVQVSLSPKAHLFQWSYPDIAIVDHVFFYLGHCKQFCNVT